MLEGKKELFYGRNGDKKEKEKEKEGKSESERKKMVSLLKKKWMSVEVGANAWLWW